MRDSKAGALKHINGQNFSAEIRDEYVFIRVWGDMTISEAERGTAAVISLARASGFRAIALDLEHLNWINDLMLRYRAIELFHSALEICDKVALISTRPAIIYLVSIMVRAGGLRFRSFRDERSAVTWFNAAS